MAAEALLKEVEERRKKLLSELQLDYSRKKEEILNSAKSEAQSIIARAMVDAESAAQRERARVLGASKLEGKRIIFEAAEEVAEENISMLREMLAEFSATQQYRQLLEKMLSYASKRLGKIVVRCRQKDADYISSLGYEIASKDLISSGGFIAYTKDRSLELDLTFEELLRINEDKVRAFLSERGQ